MSEPATNETQSSSQILLREPTFHFFIIAAFIFAVSAWINRNSENLLEIDQRELDARLFMQEMSAGEALSEEQRQFITNNFVEEQILVREALALGLDNDARIHDLLAQKMRHVLSGDIIQPTDEELRSYYEENLSRYQEAAKVDVEELVFDSREPLTANILSLLAESSDSADLLALEEGISAPLNNVTETDLRNIFDAEFATAVFAATAEQWAGPFVSNRGQHWLKVLQTSPARVPQLEEIRDRVRLEWITEEEDARLQAQVALLWEKYTVRIIEGDNEE